MLMSPVRQAVASALCTVAIYGGFAIGYAALSPVPVTRPGLTVLATVAIATDDELQLAEVVRSCVVPSEKVPKAVNATVVFWARERLDGVTVIEIRTAAVTVTVADPDTPS